MPVDLRQLWGLGPPTSPDPAVLERIEEARQAFLAAIERTNDALQWTATHAPPDAHDELVRRRDKLYALYGRIVALGGGDQRAIDGLVEHVGRLRDDARQLARTAERDKRLWEQHAPTLSETEDLVAGGRDESTISAVQSELDQVAEAVAARDYRAAIRPLQAAAQKARRLATPGDLASTDAPQAVNERRYPLAPPLPAPPEAPADPRELSAWQNPLVDVDPKQLFSAERMDAVVDMHFQGESTPKNPALNQAMKAILFAEPGTDVSEHVAKLGELRGLTPEQIDMQYERFKQLQQVALDMKTARGLPDDPVLSTRKEEYLREHGDFLGTRSSLRFGQVVGEATGLDPALAALLNPTGGMVGPGMDVLAPTDADSPVIWHGIFHDAGGYLLNYQNTGPGYTYLIEPESGRRGVDPMQGQVEGVSYWYERRQPDRSILEDLSAADGEQMAYAAYVSDPIARAEQAALDLTQDAVAEVRAAARDVRGANRAAAEQAVATTRAMTVRVDANCVEAEAAVDQLAAAAREMGLDATEVEAAESAIDARLAAIQAEVAELDQAVVNQIREASAEVDRNVAAIETWAAAAGSAVADRVGQLADEAEESVHAELVALQQDEELLNFARQAANSYGEAMTDLAAFREDVRRQVAAAEAEVRELAAAAERQVGQAVEGVNQGIEATERELAAAKEQAIARLEEVRLAAEQGVVEATQEAIAAQQQLETVGQEIRDEAGGIVDRLEYAVDSAFDAVAAAQASATEFAAGRLDHLANLLG